jgi:hypothetical protein
LEDGLGGGWMNIPSNPAETVEENLLFAFPRAARQT